MITDYDGIWMPQLIEIQKFAEEDPDYWGRFGFDKVTVPEDCPNVKAAMPYMTDRFNTKYRFRMIGAETMEMWQEFLQNRFDDQVHRLERALRLYASNQAVIDEINAYSETYTGNNHTEGENHGDDEARFSDTPDTAINTAGDYASSVNKNHNDGNYKRDDKAGHTLTRRFGTGAEAVNMALDQWRDLQCSFVDTFENLFMNVFR